MGLDGLLRTRAGVLSGILNGVDEAVWDPARDPYLAALIETDPVKLRRKIEVAQSAIERVLREADGARKSAVEQQAL